MLDCKAGSRNFLGDVMAMRVRLLLSSVVLLSAMWLISCGHYTCGTTFGNSSCTAAGGGLHQGGGNNISVTAFVYFVIPTGGGDQIAVEALNVANSQTFHPIGNFASPPLNGGGGGGMAVANKQFLYIAGNVLDGFSIDGTTGALTPVPLSPFGISGLTVAADPQGRFLFVGGAGVINAFTVNVDGSLTVAPNSPFTNANGTPTQLVTDGVGKYLYALNGSTIAEYSYNQTNGALSPIAGSPFSASMSMVASEKTGAYLLGITGVTSEVSVFTIGAGGALSGGSQTPTGLPPIFLEVSPNGKFVYTFNQTDFSPQAPSQPMEGYGFNAGALTALTGSPFTGLDASLGRFDQSGEFLFSVQHISNTTESGEFAYGVDINGLVTSTLPNYQAPTDTYAVTDAP
jgi:6-phosphogluconolactonase (cycloisomerase 2 family)